MTELSPLVEGYRTRLIRALSYLFILILVYGYSHHNLCYGMKELQVNILDDYEHLITGAIDCHGDESSFPKMEENITRKELEDYLYEYQCILDSEGTQRAQLTKYGIVAIVPISYNECFSRANASVGKTFAMGGAFVRLRCCRALEVYQFANCKEPFSTFASTKCSTRSLC